MATTEIPREVWDDLDLSIDEDVLREDYSGRGMYGKTCVGVVGDASDLLRFTVELHRSGVDAGLDVDEVLTLLDALARRVRTDGMGTKSIFYFPGVTVADN